jgi:predicted TIM-barrel fold metal-dependent hydrolase
MPNSPKLSRIDPTILLALLAAAVPIPCRAQPAAQAKPEVKYGIRVQAGPMDSILLKDYAPASSLVTPETRVPRARFPVIDAHSHSSMNNVKTPEDAAAWVRTMDQTGVETSVVFTGAIGSEFDRQADLFLKPYPARFQVWCSLDTKDIGAPDYPERAVRELVRCYRKGARGVGELTDKGWGLQASEERAVPRDRRLRVDDPRMDPFWEKCADLNLPVNLHIADHPSCWKPLGPNQERTPDFQHFNLSGKDVSSYEELLAMRDRLLARHPKTRFVLCHLSNQGNDTAALAKTLDRFPNLYLDISARDYELGRQPRTARAFLARYPDRILFGTDMGREQRMYEGWWRLLETPDEYIPGRIWWRYYGLELPEPLLKNIYRDNALKILNWSK